MMHNDAECNLGNFEGLEDFEKACGFEDFFSL